MVSVKQAMSIPGWMSKREMYWLRGTAVNMPFGSTVVELGSWKGRSTAAIACPHFDLYCVDHWRGIYKDPTGMVAKNEDVYRVFSDNMQRHGLRPTIIKMDSMEAADLFPDGSIDWLFDDGDHPGFAANLRKWLPKVAPDGVASGHDFGIMRYPIAQTLIASGLPFHVIPGTTIWVIAKVAAINIPGFARAGRG